MKSKVTSPKVLKEQVSKIKNNIILFLKPYIELDKRFSHGDLAAQIIILCDYLMQAESKEELDFYSDTIDTILTLVNDHYLIFNLEDHKVKFLRLINQFQNNKINYDIFKEKYFSEIYLFLISVEKFLNSSNKNLFFINKIYELKNNLTQISAAFQEIEKLKISDEKSRTNLLNEKLLAIPDFQVSCENLNNHDNTSYLEESRKSIRTFQNQRSPQLKTLDNNRQFCVTVAATALTVAASASLGSNIPDLATNISDLSIASTQFAQKRTISRVINFACSVTGIICLLLPFPGSQIIGGILLAKTLCDLTNNGITFIKKGIEGRQLQKRTLEREEKINRIFYSVFNNTKQTKMNNEKDYSGLVMML